MGRGHIPSLSMPFIAQSVFRERVPEAQEVSRHRAVLMVLDGLTGEMEAEDYRSALESVGASLLVLNLKDDRQAGLMDRITNLWRSCGAIHQVLNTSERASLPLAVIRLLDTYMDSIVASARAAAKGSNSSELSRLAITVAGHQPGVLTILQPPQPCDAADFCPVASFMGKLGPEDLAAAGIDVQDLEFKPAAARQALPLEQEVLHLQGTANPQEAMTATQQAQDAAKSLDAAVLGLDAYRQGVRSSVAHCTAVQQAWSEWSAAATKVAGQVRDLVAPLETVVLPVNRHTRNTGGVRGSSLYMPGVIKAVASDWTYNKFFAHRARGGRREYRIMLLLDRSLSMHGHSAHAAMESLVVIVEALQQLGIDFALAAYGSDVTLLNGEDQPWDELAAYALLSNLTFDRQAASNDAAAIDVATDLLTATPKRGAKKVLVLTNGHSTAGGLQLARAQLRAAAAGVDVVGLGLGLEPTFVPQVYAHWATATLPSDLHCALEALFTADAGDGQQGGTYASSAAAALAGHAERSSSYYSALLASSGSEADAGEVLRTQQDVFAALTSKLGGAAELKIQPDSLTLDLCFVLDCTGSMTAWLDACKAQIKVIVQQIVPKIQEKYEGLDLNLRYALVGYRDHGDAQPLVVCDFTDNIATLESQIQALTAQGGQDIPEDILPALDMATGLDWQAKARFLLLMTDAPCHGRECNAEPDDRYPQGSPSGHTVPAVMERLRRTGIDLMLCTVRKGALDMMEAEFRKHYNCPKSNKLLKSIELFDSTKQAANCFHMVFVLDKSGSMSGSPWQQLYQAYNAMLARRGSDQSKGDLISVITFDSYPSVHHRLVPVAQHPSIPSVNRGGGTHFVPALQSAQQLLAQTPPGYTPMLIFMSDGDDGSSGSVTVMSSIRAAHAHANLQVHTIAFGSSMPLLQQMATAGGGQYHTCQSGVSLAYTFVSIAKGCTAVDGLVQRFSDILSDAISLKVMVDFL